MTADTGLMQANQGGARRLVGHTWNGALVTMAFAVNPLPFALLRGAHVDLSHVPGYLFRNASVGLMLGAVFSIVARRTRHEPRSMIPMYVATGVLVIVFRPLGMNHLREIAIADVGAIASWIVISCGILLYTRVHPQP